MYPHNGNAPPRRQTTNYDDRDQPYGRPNYMYEGGDKCFPNESPITVRQQQQGRRTGPNSGYNDYNAPYYSPTAPPTYKNQAGYNHYNSSSQTSPPHHAIRSNNADPNSPPPARPAYEAQTSPYSRNERSPHDSPSPYGQNEMAPRESSSSYGRNDMTRDSPNTYNTRANVHQSRHNGAYASFEPPSGRQHERHANGIGRGMMSRSDGISENTEQIGCRERESYGTGQRRGTKASSEQSSANGVEIPETASDGCVRSSAMTAASKPNAKRKLKKQVFALSMELIEHVSKGRLELVAEKIRQGASPDFADYDKRTPLHLAASEGRIAVVQMLLQAGVDANVTDRWGSKPVDDAMKNGYSDIARMLQAYGGKADEDTLAKEHHDGLELLQLCKNGVLKMVREAVRKGASAGFADYDRRTPLHLASCEGHVAIVDLLLQNGADAHFKDRFGRTAVDDAMCNGHVEVLRTMKERGVDVPGYIFDESHTPKYQQNMQLICMAAKGRVQDCQHCIVDGADVLFGDYDRRTPMHLACAEGHIKIVKMLLAAGADISAEDRWGQSAVDEAAKYGHEDIVKVLEQHLQASVRKST